MYLKLPPQLKLVGIYFLLPCFALFGNHSLSPLPINNPCDDIIVPPPTTSPWSNVSISAPQTLYADRNDVITFTLTSRISGLATYTITENTVPSLNSCVGPIESGAVFLIPNVPQTINFTLGRPGFITVNANIFGSGNTMYLAVEPCGITPAIAPPTDLLEFWEEQRSQLEEVDMAPIITYRPDKQIYPGLSTYKLQLDNIDNKRVSGWITIPDCDGTFPVILTLPPFGSGRIEPEYFQAQLGAISVAISIHDYDCEQFVPGNIAYQPLDHFGNRNTNYYLSSILGAIQTINYIFSMPEFDGVNLAVNGQSQGGGLAMIVAGLDDRVQYLTESLAALSDHYGMVATPPKASGFPYWLKSANDLPGMSIEEVRSELYYFDAALLAGNFTGPSLHVVSFNDDVCAPATTFAALNQMSGPKTIIAEVNTGHNAPQFWAARETFWETYLPLNPYPACPAPAALPLDLIHFEGHSQKGANSLQWITENEVNTKAFIIESSTSNHTFKVIGKVSAAGFSETIQQYNFVDNSPGSTTYYRLKMVDLDETFTYSKVIVVQNQTPKQGAIHIWPNPFQDVLQLEGLENWMNHASRITLFDRSGQIIRATSWSISANNLRIPVADLPSGLYTYSLTIDGVIIDQGKIVK